MLELGTNYSVPNSPCRFRQVLGIDCWVAPPPRWRGVRKSKYERNHLCRNFSSYPSSSWATHGIGISLLVRTSGNIDLCRKFTLSFLAFFMDRYISNRSSKTWNALCSCKHVWFAVQTWRWRGAVATSISISPPSSRGRIDERYSTISETRTDRPRGTTFHGCTVLSRIQQLLRISHDWSICITVLPNVEGDGERVSSSCNKLLDSFKRCNQQIYEEGTFQRETELLKYLPSASSHRILKLEPGILPMFIMHSSDHQSLEEQRQEWPSYCAQSTVDFHTRGLMEEEANECVRLQSVQEISNSSNQLEQAEVVVDEIFSWLGHAVR